MKHTWLNLPGLCSIALVWSCSTEDGNATGTVARCVSGQSIACAGPAGCHGSQTCRADGLGYEACRCDLVPGSAGNGPGSASGGSGGGSPNGAGGWSNQPASGGSISATGGASSACSPKDMAGFVYPAYKPARRQAGSCSEQAIQDFYTTCYSNGDCAAFQPGGARASCGACLGFTPLDASQYGPVVKLGSDAQYLAETNMAGCIELVGEPDCAARMQVAALCEYYACAAGCPLADTSSYQALMDCMAQARATVCTSAQSAAACIRDAAHVSACSGPSFETQFAAVARVFCG